MKNRESLLSAYILIGIGLYFLLKQFNIPLLEGFYSWPTLLIIIGAILLIQSYSTNNYQNLFSSVIVLGLGIHFHGVNQYSVWIDHWAVYILIIGIAFIIRYLKTKKGLLVGVILIGVALLLIFSVNIPEWFQWIHRIPNLFEQFWPLLIIGLGVYLLFKKR